MIEERFKGDHEHLEFDVKFSDKECETDIESEAFYFEISTCKKCGKVFISKQLGKIPAFDE